MTDENRKRDDKDELESDAARDLRRRAEEEARKVQTADPEPLSIEEARRLLHELCVHQIELEMQNEELRHAQVALDASRARYFDLYDLAPIGYITLGEHGLILEANLRTSTMLGIPRASLVEQPLTLFIAAGDQEIYYRHRKQLVETGEPQVCELRMKRPDGTPLWVRLESTATHRDGIGGPTYRTTMNDITDTRALQAGLAQADRMANMGILAAGVAHEINNPLTYALFYIESLSKDIPKLAESVARCREALRELVGGEMLAEIAGDGAGMMEPSALDDLSARARDAAEGMQRIKNIARGLGYFSRVDKVEPSLVDLNQAAEHAITMVANEIKCKAMLVKDLGRVPLILASDGKLAQVFLNLIVNAVHAIDEGAVDDNRISVRTWAESAHVFAEVRDTGCGIPTQDLDTIFEPFFTTKGPERGTGLGLAISRRIVTELGGDIRVESAVGEGSRFTIRFPIGGPIANMSSSPPSANETPETRARILMVDDEEMIREIVSLMLQPEHDVVTAGSGAEAKKILSADTRFDIILCDLMMPDIPGIDLHAWLADHDPRLARQMVFVTGGAFTPRTTEYLDRVANIRLEKPFDAKILKKLVRKLIRART